MRLLVVVAHPDDESFGCGSVLAHAGARGDTTAVLCATRGEAGESRVATDDLAAVRESELRAASGVLGVEAVILLDHADSGMEGDPAPGTLAAADPVAVVEQVRAVIDDRRPDVIVTLDGSDGHRDHAIMRDAAIAAAGSAAHPPAAVYLTCLTRSTMDRWAEHMAATGGGEAYLGRALGTPDDQITLVVDVGAELDTRWEAIRAHASQASPFDELPPGLQTEFLATERLRLAWGDDALAAWRAIPRTASG
jgi:LmbE family N-acetylglucosaminyl deacetylase